MNTRDDPVNIIETDERHDHNLSSSRTYKPLAIPPREHFEQARGNRSVSSMDTRDIELDEDRFAEIVIEQDTSIPQPVSTVPQHIEPDTNEIRAKYREMRLLAASTSWVQESREHIFYKQAKFMEDFIDDYQHEVRFKRYYPSYEKMDSEQLRTYFTWRAKARSGDIREISLSYAFVYIYELLHLIGYNNAEDSLDQLTFFWKEFREYEPKLDQYVVTWLKEFQIYYELPYSFEKYMTDHNLEAVFPTISCYSSNKENSFDIFHALSGYDLTASVFYTKEHQEMIHDCFFFVIERLREAFSAKHKTFEDYLFYLKNRKSRWIPFSTALFYAPAKQEDRVVKLSEREIYECENGEWSFKTVLPSDHGKQLIGYIMKEMEASLRTIKKFKRKLSPNLNSCKAVDQSVFDKLDISIPDVVKRATQDFYDRHTWKPVVVDTTNLKRIRAEAFDTQEKLIVSEDNEDVNSIVERAKEPALAPAKVNENPTPARAALSTSAPQPFGPWDAFEEALSPVEKEALASIFRKEDIKQLADANNIMMEVLIDSINEKAIDHIGDTLIETDLEPYVYEDYYDNIQELVSH